MSDLIKGPRRFGVWELLLYMYHPVLTDTVIQTLAHTSSVNTNALSCVCDIDISTHTTLPYTVHMSKRLAYRPDLSTGFPESSTL